MKLNLILSAFLVGLMSFSSLANQPMEKSITFDDPRIERNGKEFKILKALQENGAESGLTFFINAADVFCLKNGFARSGKTSAANNQAGPYVILDLDAFNQPDIKTKRFVWNKFGAFIYTSIECKYRL